MAMRTGPSTGIGATETLCSMGQSAGRGMGVGGALSVPASMSHYFPSAGQRAVALTRPRPGPMTRKIDHGRTRGRARGRTRIRSFSSSACSACSASAPVPLAVAKLFLLCPVRQLTHSPPYDESFILHLLTLTPTPDSHNWLRNEAGTAIASTLAGHTSLQSIILW